MKTIKTIAQIIEKRKIIDRPTYSVTIFTLSAYNPAILTQNGFRKITDQRTVAEAREALFAAYPDAVLVSSPEQFSELQECMLEEAYAAGII